MAKGKTEVRYVSPFEGYFDADGVQVTSGQDERGREIPDPVPLSPPAGYRHPPTLADMIKRMVQHELLAQAADLEDIDTFEEAEDFDIEDDPVDPRTPYEAVFDPPPAGSGGSRGAAADVAAAPNPSPTNASEVTNQGPNVKRSESNDSSPNNRTADHPGSTGAGRGSGATQADPRGAAQVMHSTST